MTTKDISYYGEEIQNNNDNSTTYKLRRKIDLITGSIIQIYLEPTSYENFTDQYCNYYLGSNKDIIVNGTLQPETFSGEFYDNYIEQIGNQNLIDTIESGNDFWREAYDNLFTISSGDIKNILDSWTAESGLENFGDLGIEEEILGILNGQPTDFKISWGNIGIPNLKDNDPITLIESGDVNFSKMVRENQALNTTMQYTRAIMSYSVIILMISNIWKTLMIVLGVGVQMYDDNEEEMQRMETQTSETVNINGDTGEFTRTLSMYDPKTKYRQNIHYKGK